MFEAMASNTLSSVANAMRVLKAFTSANPSWGITELSKHLNLSKSSVHRIVTTLTDQDVLEQDRDSSRYRLGLSIFDLAAAVPFKRGLYEAALLPMTELRHRTGETVHIGVLDGRQVVYIERLDSPHTLQFFTELGRRNHAHCTASGKVLLAFSPAERQAIILKRWKLTQETEYTITSMPDLRDALEVVRRQGFAENRHESKLGVVSIAAPIRDGTGACIAAMSVAGPPDRIDENRTAIANAVVVLARVASERLGFTGRA